MAATDQDEKTSPHTDTSTAATALTTATATPWLIFAAAATADHYHHITCGVVTLVPWHHVMVTLYRITWFLFTGIPSIFLNF